MSLFDDLIYETPPASDRGHQARRPAGEPYLCELGESMPTGKWWTDQRCRSCMGGLAALARSGLQPTIQTMDEHNKYVIHALAPAEVLRAIAYREEHDLFTVPALQSIEHARTCP